MGVAEEKAYLDFLIDRRAKSLGAGPDVIIKVSDLTKVRETDRLSKDSGYFLRFHDSDDLVDLNEVVDRFPSLGRLRINDKTINVSALARAKNLLSLAIAPKNMAEKIDLSDLRRLKHVCVFENVKKINLKSNSLETFELWDNRTSYPDLGFIENFPNLEKICLIKSKIQSLEKIGNFKKLEELVMYSIPKLASLSGLEDVASSLKRLEIDVCRHWNDPKPISELRHLRSLTMDRVGDLQSLLFILPLKSLEFFQFFNGSVLDNKTSLLKELPILQSAMYTNKKTYDMRCEEIEKRWVAKKRP